MTKDVTAIQGDKVPMWNDPKARALAIQVAVVAILAVAGLVILRNTISNLSRMGQNFGFAFLTKTSGFDIFQALVPYSSESTYARALAVGLLNTALISSLCVVASTMLGFVVGVMRLSKNRLAARIGGIYVEFFRNVPLLLQIFVWYSLIVLQTLPPPRDAYDFLGLSYLSNRGFMVPRPLFGAGSSSGLIGLLVALAAAVMLRRWARRRLEETGRSFPTVAVSLALLALLPMVGLLLAGLPVRLDFPVKTTFNFSGGLVIAPEFIALFLALSIYHATYIAEAVRAGVSAVSRGQTEAAQALGLSPAQALSNVVVPQALRVIIPPLATIYMGVIKNSSLAVAIGYPDLVAVGGTVMNQTGRAIEIVLIWMLVYLSLSLTTSVFMNWFNARMKLVER
ncbi:MAG: amino acid ABC transporter permease [Mesorhizobium sp.]|uniref:amino acid ABC transporter permease n=1 Tax=Mesorhizobium sp. TaxID=1871066 RepID=UPI001AC4DBDF|nr:amino acid ABC transporter permease [Mesorhizobium sp.]MBN9217261.1 amino acid ABC transporter permease [Mesorhizobium sp.]